MHEGGYYARFRRLVTNGQEFSTILPRHDHTDREKKRDRERRAISSHVSFLVSSSIMTFLLEGVGGLVIRFVQPKT